MNNSGDEELSEHMSADSLIAAELSRMTAVADIRLAVDRRVGKQKPEEPRQYRNNRELVPAELRDQEEVRYVQYKAQRLGDVANKASKGKKRADGQDKPIF